MATSPSRRPRLWPVLACMVIVACGGDPITSSTTPTISTTSTAPTISTTSTIPTTSTTSTTAPDQRAETSAPATSTATAPPTTSTITPPTTDPEDPMTSTPDSPVPADVIAGALVQAAIDDLVERTGADRAAIEVASVDEVEWTDGSLGCPQPGMSYTQALVNGTRIVLRHDGTDYAYHQGGSRSVFYCPPQYVQPAAGDIRDPNR